MLRVFADNGRARRFSDKHGWYPTRSVESQRLSAESGPARVHLERRCTSSIRVDNSTPSEDVEELQ